MKGQDTLENLVQILIFDEIDHNEKDFGGFGYFLPSLIAIKIENIANMEAKLSEKEKLINALARQF